MAAANFPAVMEHIFAFEGGYVDHPNDPGGATNMGITIGTLRDYRGGSVSTDDVRNLSKAEASEIYRKRYWDAIEGDLLPAGVDLCTMDSAVNSGPSRGARWLQRAIGAKADGKVGPNTLAAAEEADDATTINRMCDDRMGFLKGLSHWRTFGKGWTRRVEAVRSNALSMVTDEMAPVVSPPATETPPRAPLVKRYTKAVAAVIGGFLFWAAGQGIIDDAGVFQPLVEPLSAVLGAAIAAAVSPKNAE